MPERWLWRSGSFATRVRCATTRTRSPSFASSCGVPRSVSETEPAPSRPPRERNDRNAGEPHTVAWNVRRSALLASILLLLSSLIAAPASASTPDPTARATATTTCMKKIGPGIPPPAATPVKLGGFHASWYGQSGYMTLCPGDSETATVAYYNSGSLGWIQGKMGESAYLGTWGPEPGQDRASVIGGDGTNGSPSTGWVRYNRPAIQPAFYVGPGQVAWFQFTVKAPAAPLGEDRQLDARASALRHQRRRPGVGNARRGLHHASQPRVPLA